jgi:phage terminase large subunit-like protein
MTRAGRVISFIQKYCVTPEGVHVGKPLVLAEFQKTFIRAIFDNPHGTRRAMLSVGRKSGKSTLTAGILLAFIAGPEAKQNSSICSGAMSRDQAALIFNAAAKMVQLSPALSKLVKVFPSGKRLLGLPMNVEFKALAADGKTAMGGTTT